MSNDSASSQNGILIVNKARGITSFDVIRRLRKILKIKKIGHAGTLDPLATGVLVIAFGKATRLLQYLQAGTKKYEATFKLGEETDTLDSDGVILSTAPVPHLELKNIQSSCDSFIGEILQIPPVYSAIKKNGVPLYKLARQGKKISPEGRLIKILNIEVVSLDLPYVTIKVTCGKGTYIRSLVRDLGTQFGCGAHLTKLIRTGSKPFYLDTALTLEQIEALYEKKQFSQARISPVHALSQIHHIPVVEEQVKSLQNGHMITVTEWKGTFDNKNKEEEFAAVFDEKLVAIGKKIDDLVFKPTKVFSPPI